MRSIEASPDNLADQRQDENLRGPELEQVTLTSEEQTAFEALARSYGDIAMGVDLLGSTLGTPPAPAFDSDDPGWG